MAPLVIAIIVGALLFIPVHKRFPWLRASGAAFVILPQATFLALDREWYNVLFAVGVCVPFIVVDIVRYKRRR